MTVGLTILALLFACRRNERAILLPAGRNVNILVNDNNKKVTVIK